MKEPTKPEQLTINHVTPCKSHKPHNLDMMQWYGWIEEKSRKGATQKQCTICGYWFFKEEF